jgi:ABC-2 type transport system permease protein
MRSIIVVAHKELRQIVRDRRTLLTLLFVPAVLLLLYGYALNFDIRNVSLTIDDRDRSRESRQLVSAFVNSGYFTQTTEPRSPDQLNAAMDRGDARVALVIPEQFGRDILSGRPVDVQVIIDGDNANTATTVMGYARTIINETSRRVASETAPGQPPATPIVLEPRVWYNPELRSALFLVPGLIAFIAMITAVVSTALSVVREKERGTMEQIRMAPVGTLSYILGKTLPYLVLSFLSALLIILVAMVLFDLPMHGSWLLLCLAITVFLIGAQGQGLLISTVADTQQVAFQLALLSSFLPTLILSGFIFPISSMPEPVQWVTHIVPARYFLVALRGVVLKGTDVTVWWTDLAALCAFATVMLGLASVRLSREWS